MDIISRVQSCHQHGNWQNRLKTKSIKMKLIHMEIALRNWENQLGYVAVIRILFCIFGLQVVNQVVAPFNVVTTLNYKSNYKSCSPMWEKGGIIYALHRSIQRTHICGRLKAGQKFPACPYL